MHAMQSRECIYACQIRVYALHVPCTSPTVVEVRHTSVSATTKQQWAMLQVMQVRPSCAKVTTHVHIVKRVLCQCL